MIYPEGYWNWQKIIYPGVAKIAHKSNTPIIPTGIENGYTFRPELDDQPPLKAIGRILSDYRKLKEIIIHFDEPIYPDQSLKEKEDISRIMNILENKFDEYYRNFYNIEGPKIIDKN
jgi:1-acyl-sn-glycerol-3-phosphate acyltransferase